MKVEPLPGSFTHQLSEFGLTILFGNAANIDGLDRKIDTGLDSLYDGVAGTNEMGTEGAVPASDLVDSALEQIDVDCAFESPSRRQVVDQFL